MGTTGVSAAAVSTIHQSATDHRTTIYATVLVSQIGNVGAAIKSDDTGKKDTVAVPELRRIQELHRVILTGVDVFAQVRFPDQNHCSGVVPPQFWSKQ